MALFQKIRSQTDSTIARLMFIAVVLVFVFWGVGASGPRTRTIAEVNGKRITDIDLQKLMRVYGRQQQGALNDDEVLKMQDNALEELIATKALLQEAERLDVEVSDQEIAFQILQFEGFKGPDGKFSEELYDQILSREGFTQGAYESQIRQDITLSKIRSLVNKSVYVSDAEVKRMHREFSTEMTVSWVRVPEFAVKKKVVVSGADIDAKIASSTEELKQIYEADLERVYKRPEQIRYESLRLNLEEDTVIEDAKAKMAALREEAVGGAKLAELAARDGLEHKASGAGDWSAKPQLAPEIGEVLFGAELGAVTEVLEPNGALTIMVVLEKNPAKEIPFEEAQRDIASEQLKTEKLGAEMKELAEQVKNQWKAGEVQEQVLAEYGLQIDSAGPFPLIQPQLPGAGNSPELFAALKLVEEPKVLDGVYSTNGGLIVAKVDEIQSSNTVDADREQAALRARLEQQRNMEFFAAYQQDIVKNSEVWYADK